MPSLPPEPRTREQLARVVRELFDVRLPGKPLCDGHATPLDYLAGSFLHQQDLLVWANRGGGKTMAAAVATLLDGLYRAPAKLLVLGGSFDQSDRLAEHIRTFLLDRPHLLEGRMTKQRIRLAGGSEIRMLAQSQRAVRGQHVQKIRCDEVDLFDPDVWRAAQFATRSDGAARGSIEVLSTLHRAGGLMDGLVAEAQPALSKEPSPNDGGEGNSIRPSVFGLRHSPVGYRLVHWCLWEVIERCPAWRQCPDCPLAADCRGRAKDAEGFFPIADAITIQARSSRAAWESEMLCKGVRAEGLVFGEFDRARHVRPLSFEAHWPTYRGVDFGYTDPFVCLWMQVTPDGVVHVLAEYVQARRSVERHAQEIRRQDEALAGAQYGRIPAFVDPAGRQKQATSGRSCVEAMQRAGIPCRCVFNAIGDGLELIRAALAPAEGPPRLAIAPECRRLIAAFEAYHYPPPGSAADPEKPVKDGPDHLIDALRYFFVCKARPGVDVARVRY